MMLWGALMKTLKSFLLILFLFSLGAKAEVDCEHIEILPNLHKRIIDVLAKPDPESVTACTDKITLTHNLISCTEERIKIDFRIRSLQYGRTFDQTLTFDADLRGNAPDVTFKPVDARSFDKFNIDEYTMNLEYKARPIDGKSSKITMDFKITNDDEIETFNLTQRLSGWFQKTRSWKCFN